MFDTYPTEAECLKEFNYCRTKKRSIDDKKMGFWVKECSPNKIQLGFMCIPVCMSEMDNKMLDTLKSDNKYCIEDYINLGMPFYDFN